MGSALSIDLKEKKFTRVSDSFTTTVNQSSFEVTQTGDSKPMFSFQDDRLTLVTDDTKCHSDEFVFIVDNSFGGVRCGDERLSIRQHGDEFSIYNGIVCLNNECIMSPEAEKVAIKNGNVSADGVPIYTFSSRNSTTFLKKNEP